MHLLLTTDGLASYLPAVEEIISDRVDFAQLVKIYKSPREGEHRYSPAEIGEALPVVISGKPNKYRICTSHVERQNLTMRMQIRRLTRLTNAFSKNLDNHKAAIALHFAYYNFCQIHQTLRYACDGGGNHGSSMDVTRTDRGLRSGAASSSRVNQVQV